MRTRICFFVLLFPLVFISCKKNQEGGNAEITGIVAHHATPSPNATIYVTYAAKEFPGTDLSVYDTQLKADADGKYSFHCYKGDYYLYAVGTDAAPSLVTVDGGVPASVRAKEVVITNIAVSEVH